MKKKTKVLLIIDPQVDFITGSLENKEADKKVPNIVNKIKSFDGEYIFVTRDTHDEEYLNSKEGKMLPIEHCIFKTDGWFIDSRIAEALQSHELLETGIMVHYINKPTFGSTELLEKLRNISGELKIEIVGFVSSICVVTNALILKTGLFDRADISVDANCIAGLNEYNNNAAIEVMKSCQIKIINEEN